jgi:hypothetical protein
LTTQNLTNEDGQVCVTHPIDLTEIIYRVRKAHLAADI